MHPGGELVRSNAMFPRTGGIGCVSGASAISGFRDSTSSTRTIDAAACWYMFSVQPRLIMGIDSRTM